MDDGMILCIFFKLVSKKEGGSKHREEGDLPLCPSPSK